MEHSIQHVSAATRSRPACLPSAAASENYIRGRKVVFCRNGIRCLTLRTASVEQERKSVASLFDDVKSGVFNSASNCKSTRNDSSITGYYTPMERIPCFPMDRQAANRIWLPTQQRVCNLINLHIRSHLDTTAKTTNHNNPLYHTNPPSKTWKQTNIATRKY